ncbi:MAG: HAD family hydrolase [Bacteroidetes bacterium]|nr:HAD family hydrolase [Bacteroidota bacterium]
MNPERIQFIYFDLDDTLLDHRQAERRGLADVRRAHPTHFSPIPLDTLHATYHAHSVPLWRQYADGEIDKHDLQRLRFERTLHALGLNGLEAEALNALYLDCYARHWTFPHDARDAFLTLADHFPVGILTNGFAEIQHAKFDRFPELRERAEVLIISEEFGYMKPHPQIFAHAAAVARTPPEALLYIGDSYTSDVQGAVKAGWQMAWFTTEKTGDKQAGNEAVFCFEQWDALTNFLFSERK